MYRFSFKFIYLFVSFGHAESSLLLELSVVVGSSRLFVARAQASHCGGFSCFRAQVLGAWASVVAEVT